MEAEVIGIDHLYLLAVVQLDDASPGPGTATLVVSSGMEPTPDELREWEAEFAAAARRPLRVRLRYAFIRTYKPVLDDASYRSFDSTAQYRRWCEASLPTWLGYGPAV